MHLVALVESEAHVCCRYRLAAFRPLLSLAGHSLEIRSFPHSFFGRLSVGRTLVDADAVIIQRKLLSRLPLALLRRRVRRLVFDFDDAVWLRDSYSPRGFNDPRRIRRFRSIVQASDLVVAGNEFLAVEAHRWTGPSRVTVIPTCVDTTRYTTHPDKTAGSGLRLVWIGSSSTLQGLERFAPTLSAIGKAIPGTRLKLICDRFIDIPNLAIDRCPWNEQTEPGELAAADVGIGWVPDDPWSWGKCGLKVLQYQAAGLPVVANPVGVQKDFVQHGKTGFLATTTDEWIDSLRQLYREPVLRSRMGTTGQREIQMRFSVSSGAMKWIAALERFREVRKVA